MIPARHLLELNALPEIARASAVLTRFLRYPGAFVSSAPSIPAAMSSPPTRECARLEGRRRAPAPK
eukprot:12533684-Heterocapsa_arctica.AAC.1